MIAERDRHRAVVRGEHRGRDRELAATQRGHEQHLVGERKRAQTLVVAAEVEPREQHAPGVGADVVLHGPAGGRGEQAVNRKTAGVERRRRRVRFEVELAPGDPEALVGDPVRPGVKQWDPHRRVLGDVGGQTSALAKQLLATVAQRATDHAGAGDERRLDSTGRVRGERQRLVAVDGSLADQDQKIAVGFRGEPVPPGIRRGAATSRNSQRRLRSQAAARSSSCR